mgnify:FL=1
MKNLQMPSSYAVIPKEEQRSILGGGELGDAWTSFTEQLHLDDFFFGSGLISLSFTFVPMLLFRVGVAGYNFLENIYSNISNWFGYRDETLSELQAYTDDMRQKRQERGV